MEYPGTDLSTEALLPWYYEKLKSLPKGSRSGGASHPAMCGLSEKLNLKMHSRSYSLIAKLFVTKQTLKMNTEWLANLLFHGDSRAAVVVSIHPLIVSAYTDELDTALLLSFPKVFVKRFQLEAGQRLLSANSYCFECNGARQTAADLEEGPKATGTFANFIPIICEFLSEDSGRIEQRKREIDKREWQYAMKIGKRLLNESKYEPRDGRPWYRDEVGRLKPT
ncbi:MAG: hypothetical protein KDA78_08060 [Planctomycetaceae bacterium]|nr:hypothetical protein [Planctomycetaceae bacterium]